MADKKFQALKKEITMLAAIYRNRFWISAAFTLTVFYFSAGVRKELPFLNLLIFGLGIYSYFFIKSKFRISHGQIVLRDLPLHPKENESLNWISFPRLIPTNSFSTARREYDCALCKKGYKKGAQYYYFWRKGSSRPRNPTKYCSTCANLIPVINAENIQLESEQRKAVDSLRNEIKSYYAINSLGPEKIIEILTPEQQDAAVKKSIQREKLFDYFLKAAFGIYIALGILVTISKPFRSSTSYSQNRSSYSYSGSYSSGANLSVKISNASKDESYSAVPDYPSTSRKEDSITPPSNSHKIYHKVVRVIDGDTLELEDVGTVRLIGIDTPETVHPRKKVEFLGPDASRFLRQLVHGKDVRIEFDHNQKDRFGRTLGYLYLRDNTSLNEEIIKEGFSSAYTKYAFNKSLEYKVLEENAKKNRKGLWKHTAFNRDIFDCYDKNCSEITSCAEAYHLYRCGLRQLDGDEDGVPCEEICR